MRRARKYSNNSRTPSRSLRAFRLPLIIFCALAGTTWYFQFFFYTMGKTQMGRYEFSSWTLHMASIIIFSTLWGIALREWKGASRRTVALVVCGLAALVSATIIVGYGNYLGTLPGTALARSLRLTNTFSTGNY